MMKLYHGTNVKFSELNPNLSRNGLDFGKGSYLTPDIEQAWAMARRKQLIFGGQRLVIEYDFDDTCLYDTDSGCLNFDTYNEDWTAFVLKNRNKIWNFSHSYLVISGPVADGIMPTVINDYLKTFPDEATALERSNLSRLTRQLIFHKAEARQVCFHTAEAVKKYLKFVTIYEQ